MPLLFPGDPTIRDGVFQTLSVGQLPPDCASVQFNEDLPKVPDPLVKVEFEAHSGLESTLSSFTLEELASLILPYIESLKVLTNSMVS